MSINEIKVYRMDDYNWVATKCDIEKTNKYYEAELNGGEENPIEGVMQCDLDNEGMWWSTENKDDIERLGDYDEIIGVEIVKGMHKRKTTFGNLMRCDDKVYKYISFREAIEKDLNFTEPYVIASTEY